MPHDQIHDDCVPVEAQKRLFGKKEEHARDSSTVEAVVEAELCSEGAETRARIPRLSSPALQPGLGRPLSTSVLVHRPFIPTGRDLTIALLTGGPPT